MAVFQIQSKKLIPIREKKFDLERDIQRLTEANLNTVLGLTFISGSTNQEFSVRAQEQDFYIDTLAFDDSQKSFVIIEYKKDKSISVIDQGFAYLSAMLNHKADFVLEINERLGRSYTKKDIDWEQSRVIFVSPEFTNYQRNAINFKDLPIYLYEVRLYENNLIDYTPIKPYRTTESIDLLSKDKTIQSVTKEVNAYTEEHVVGKDKERLLLYSELKKELESINQSFIFHPTKNYIGLQIPGNWRNIIGIESFSQGLRIFFNRSQPSDFIDPESRLFYRENSFKVFNQHMSGLVVESIDDVAYFISLFRQLYDRFLKEYNN